MANFTSSNVWKLIKKGSRPMTEEEKKAYKEKNPKGQKRNIDDGFSAGGETYINEKRQEQKRKRSLNLDSYSRALAWGDLMELLVYDMIGLEYQIQSKETTKHASVPRWSGSCDLLVPGIKVGEIKCYQPKMFCDYADMLLQKDLDLFRTDFAEEYWQIVSNAAIHGVSHGEALAFLPYDSMAPMIAEFAVEYDGDDAWKYRYIYEEIYKGDLHKLPFQPDDSEYPALVTWEFEVPNEDILYLESRILEATKLL